MRRHVVRPDDAEALPVHQSQITAVYTGVVPIVYKAQRALLDNLIQSSFWSFVTITPLMMLVCRSISGGAVVMLPNVLPVLVVFGGMGWLGVADRHRLDDGGQHRAGRGGGRHDPLPDVVPRRARWSLAIGRRPLFPPTGVVRPPTLQAALISGLGLAVFAFSTFTPTQRLGWLMMTILMAGVVAELVMMPAILAGPLGKVFTVPNKATAVAHSRTPRAAAEGSARIVADVTA